MNDRVAESATDVRTQPAEPRARALEALRARLEAEPWRFHLYAAMRKLEALHADAPRFGRAARPKDEPVRFGQEPSLAFAPSTISAFRRDGARARLDQHVLGLFGPNGPLPLHLTEFVHQRERNFHDATFRRFADLFHHRMIELFYRVWAESQPVTHADRPTEDRFAFYVGTIAGHGLDALRDADALPDAARLHWAGLLAMPTRPAEALERVLAGFHGAPVEIEPCVGHWIHLDPAMTTRLGRANERLGATAMLGERVWDCAGKFRVKVGPVGYSVFERFLPGKESLSRLAAIVRTWTGDALAWDLQVVLARDEVPATRLDARSGLGWNTWLLGARATRDAHEYVIDPMALRSAAA